jgi:hypothetical protein
MLADGNGSTFRFSRKGYSSRLASNRFGMSACYTIFGGALLLGRYLRQDAVRDIREAGRAVRWRPNYY